jgi:CRP-like cAMP-binding protein
MPSEKKSLISFLLGSQVVSPSKAEEIAEEFSEKIIARNEFHFREGRVYNEYLFLEDGHMRAFAYKPDGADITTNFYSPNQVVFDVSSFFTRTISRENFQALTDMALIEFSAEQFLSLMIQNIEIRNLGNTILLKELISKTEREIALASLTAKERLIKFRSEYGILENLISHTVIASYLGITNVSLSRLRSDVKG